MKRLLLLLSLIGILLFASFKASAQNTLSAEDLEKLLTKAEQANAQYFEIFKNLSAEETKIFEDFKDNGEVKEKRIIKSNFFAYQSPKTNEVNEFRYVFEFNGAKVGQSDNNTEKFFDDLQTAESEEKEVQKLRLEGTRYDGSTTAWGMTLRQNLPLGRLRPFFEFKVVNAETIEGRNVFVIEYHQNKPCHLILVKPSKEEITKEPKALQYNTIISPAFRPTNPILDGKLWLDAETGQVWRNEYKVILHPPQLSKAVVSVEFLYEYQSSNFNILVPKRFIFLTHKIAGKDEKNLIVKKQRKMVFEFSKFSQLTTDIKDYKIKGDEIPNVEMNSKESGVKNQ